MQEKNAGSFHKNELYCLQCPSWSFLSCDMGQVGSKAGLLVAPEISRLAQVPVKSSVCTGHGSRQDKAGAAGPWKASQA